MKVPDDEAQLHIHLTWNGHEWVPELTSAKTPNKLDAAVETIRASQARTLRECRTVADAIRRDDTLWREDTAVAVAQEKLRELCRMVLE